MGCIGQNLVCADEVPRDGYDPTVHCRREQTGRYGHANLEMINEVVSETAHANASIYYLQTTYQRICLIIEQRYCNAQTTEEGYSERLS